MTQDRGMNIETKLLNIPTESGQCDSFVAFPKDGGSHPAVIVFMDIYGPRNNLYKMCEQMAGFGFYVLLPNIFYRHKKVPLTDGKFPLTEKTREAALAQVLPFLRSLNHHEVMKDVGSFIHFLREQPEVKNSPMGTVGYCMGGGLSLRAAADYHEDIGVAASFHGGGLVSDDVESVHLQLKNIKGEIYAAHADEDQSMTDLMIEIFETAMRDAEVKGTSEIYKGSKHGFAMLDLPAGNEEAAQRHWENLERILKKLS